MDLPDCLCTHPANQHLLTTRPPRKHKACSVHEGGTKCPCLAYTPVVKT